MPAVEVRVRKSNRSFIKMIFLQELQFLLFGPLLIVKLRRKQKKQQFVFLQLLKRKFKS